MTSGTPTMLRRVIAVLALAVASCAPYQVRTDYDEEISFTAFRTFAWMDSAARQDDERNPFLERRIRRAVELVMRERGLTMASASDADLLVTAFVIGPSRQDRGRARWSPIACGPSVRVWIGPRYPYGFSRRGTSWLFRTSYWRDPWGYACSYRIGFGYVWFPLYDAPGDRMGGTLVVDVLERASGELLWRGSAEGALIDPMAPEQSQDQEAIDAIVREVLTRFPPR